MDQQSFPTPKSSNKNLSYEVGQDRGVTEVDLDISHGTKENKGQELPKETNELQLQLDEGNFSSNMLVSTHLDEIGPSVLKEKLMDSGMLSKKNQTLESPPGPHKYTTRSWKHRAKKLKHRPPTILEKKIRTKPDYESKEESIAKRNK